MSKQKGYSLLELMMALALAGMLMSMATVHYRQHTVRVHRVEASMALLELSMRLESYHADYQTYEGVPSSALLGMMSDVSYTVVVDYASASTYQLRAVPLREDPPCGQFLLNERGVKAVTGWAGLGVCWP